MGQYLDENIPHKPQHKRPKITRESIERIQSGKMVEHSLSIPVINNKNEDELQRLKALTLKLENAYQNAQTRNEALHIEYKTKFSEYDGIISQLTSEKAEAEARAIYHNKKAQDAMDSLDLIKSDHSAITERLRLTMDELEAKNSRLSSDLISAQSGRERSSLELQTKQSEWISRIHHLEDSVKVLENQVQHQQASIGEGLKREAELTKKWMESDAQLQQLNNARFDTEAIVAFDRQIKLQDDTRKVEIENYKLKGELKHYKELYHNVEMLREEKYSLESRVREMDKMVADNLRLDRENTRLKLEKSEWAGYLEETDGIDFETPQGIVYNLTKERYESRLASTQVTALQDSLKNRDSLLSTLETHINDLKKLNQEKDRIHRSDILAMELLEKDKSLLKKHVDMLENQFKLYDVEEENYMEGNYDRQKTQRIQELEGLLKEFEDRLSTQAQDIIKSQMNASYSSTVPVPPGPYSGIASGQSIVEFMSKLMEDQQTWIENEKTLRSEINSQVNTIKITKNQLHLLQELIERHEMQPNSSAQLSESNDEHQDGTRIVEFEKNFAKVEHGIRKQQLDDLRNENKELLERLLQYQDSMEGNEAMDISGGDMEKATGDTDEENVTIPRCTLRNLQSEIQTLEGEIAKKKKRIDRNLEQYEKRIEAFKDNVASVLGYRINTDILGNTMYLRSTFANGRDLEFVIKSLKNDQTGVGIRGRKQEEYLRKFQYAHDLYLGEPPNCIPCYLSQVTLDLQTQKLDMDDAATAQNDNTHNYLEQNPVTDFQGHELVHPEPIDKEDELDTDFVAEADDSGDNDYVECVSGNAEGYDGDRLQYFDGQDEDDTEDYSPRMENREIRHQEITGESTYEGYDDDMDSADYSDDNKIMGEDGDGINDGINYGDGGTDGIIHSSDDNHYNSGNMDFDDGDDEESGMDYSDDMVPSFSARYGQPQPPQHPQQGQENDPISLDDSSDD